MSLSFETLILDIDESGIATLSINRPKQLNALNNQVFEDLDAAIDEVISNDAIKAVIITGAGDKAFVAGADIKEFADFNSEQAVTLSSRGHRVFQKLEDVTKPVVAAIQGYALGGGFELALACHLRVASQTTVVGLPEVSLGLIPGYGGTQRLPQLVGKAKALELIMSGRFVKAEEALQLGIVNQIAEDDVLEAAKKMLQGIIRQAPIAIKNAILATKEAGKASGFGSEAKLFGELFSTADFKEGTSAFIEKRKPNFSGK
ncbi:MAG: enoyl-CoA hydratase [Balneola sp.]|nr:MAG: enoyl-CoA hydratase [Balneola sp.]